MINDDFIKMVKAFLFSNIDEELLQSEVEQLREEFPAHSSYEISDILVKRTSLLTGVSGGITGAIPWPMTLLFAVPDLAAVMILQTKMILKIAVLADKDPLDDSRFTEIIGCFGVSAGAVAGTVGIRRLVDVGLSPFLLSAILKSFMKASSSKLIPLFGCLAGGVLNFSATLGVGAIARDFYFPDKAEITGFSEHKSESEEEKADEEEEEDSRNSEDIEDEETFENDIKQEQDKKDSAEAEESKPDSTDDDTFENDKAEDKAKKDSAEAEESKPDSTDDDTFENDK